ncbi:MAG: hypothetical protein RLZZ422_2143, partial [Pseudomonadota bacterium]
MHALSTNNLGGHTMNRRDFLKLLGYSGLAST